MHYDVDATESDGSSRYEGCDDVYEHALNYDEDAKFDDGSCEFEGCIDPSCSNYNPFANVQGNAVCSNSPLNADFSGDSVVSLDDMLEFLVVYSSSAPDFNGQVWAQEVATPTPYEDEVLLEEQDSRRSSRSCYERRLYLPGRSQLRRRCKKRRRILCILRMY